MAGCCLAMGACLLNMFVCSVIDLLLRLFFLTAFMFDYLMLVRDLPVCFGKQITRIFYFVLIYVETTVGMATAKWCLCLNVVHIFLFAFRRAMSWCWFSFCYCDFSLEPLYESIRR